MSNTYTRKKHRGEIQKEINKIKRQKELEAQAEREEAERWVAGTKPESKNDVKKEKERTKEEHRKELRKLYEDEMVNK